MRVSVTCIISIPALLFKRGGHFVARFLHFCCRWRKNRLQGEDLLEVECRCHSVGGIHISISPLLQQKLKRLRMSQRCGSQQRVFCLIPLAGCEQAPSQSRYPYKLFCQILSMSGSGRVFCESAHEQQRISMMSFYDMGASCRLLSGGPSGVVRRILIK